MAALWNMYSVLEVFFIYGTLNLTFYITLHYITLYFCPVQHRSRIRILRIFSFLKFNEFYEFSSVEKICKKIVILQIIDV